MIHKNLIASVISYLYPVVFLRASARTSLVTAKSWSWHPTMTPLCTIYSCSSRNTSVATSGFDYPSCGRPTIVTTLLSPV